MSNLAYGTFTITNLSIVTSVDVYYYNSTSSSSLSGGSWSTDTPTWTNGRYIWSKTVTTWEQGVTTESEPVCITGQKGSTGEAGQSVTRITQQYALGTSSTTAPTTGWTTTMPTFESGKFYWTRSEIVWANPTSTTYTTAVLANGITSANTTAAVANTNAQSAVSTANTANQTANAANQTAQNAVSTANTASQTATAAAGTATTYITDIDSNRGITIKPADASGNDYLQINSSAINFYRNNIETLKIEDSAIRVGKLGNNLRNVYITNNAVQIRNNTSVLAEYGSSITLGQESSKNVKIDTNGVTINNGSTSLASYGNIVKIGNLSKIHLDLNDTYLSLKQGNASSQLISFGLKNNSSTGLATVTKRGYMEEGNYVPEDQSEAVLSFYSDRSGWNPIMGTVIQILSCYQVIDGEVDTNNPISPSVFTIENGSIYILDVNSSLKDKMIQITYTTNDTIPFLKLGYNSQCHGVESIASGDFTTVQGQKSIAVGDHITIFGDYGLAVGEEITISSSHSMAYGYENSAQGEYSLVGGWGSATTGWTSVALGQEAKAFGDSSTALGYYVVSRGTGALACGQYNNGNSVYAFTVGNGSQSDRRNAFWVGSSGNCGVQNNLYVGGVMRSYTDGAGINTAYSTPMFWYETRTFSNLSIPANSAATQKELDIYKQDYYAVGVVGMRITNSSSGGANAANCNVYIYTIVNSDHITFSIKNFANTAAKVDVEFKVFYIATPALSSQLS